MYSSENPKMSARPDVESMMFFAVQSLKPETDPP